MKDFRCCGLTLPSTHELLQHYEENHAQQMPASLRKQSTQLDPVPGKRTAPESSDPTEGGHDQARRRQSPAEASNQTQTPASAQRTETLTNPQIAPSHIDQSAAADYQNEQLLPGQDMDGLQDMEMDMDDGAMAQSDNFQSQQYQMQDHPRMMQRSQFGQPISNRVPPPNLNTINMANPLQQHQGLRNSTPTTPIGPGRGAQLYQNNPTVSSVNTPTLSAHPRHQQQYAHTPDSSVPGTPGEPSIDFAGGIMPFGGPQFMQAFFPTSGNFYGGSNGDEMLDLCIDEPAKRLFHNGNKKYTKQSSSSQLGDGQYSENSEIARTIREQQRLAGVPDPQTDGGVPKPFHCPVIGCEKAYKNQNGLKYHKAVRITAFFHDSYKGLTPNSMDITPNSSPPTKMVLSQLSTRKHTLLTPVLLEWKSTSRIVATCVGKDTRT